MSSGFLPSQILSFAPAHAEVREPFSPERPRKIFSGLFHFPFFSPFISYFESVLSVSVLRQTVAGRVRPLSLRIPW